MAIEASGEAASVSSDDSERFARFRRNRTRRALARCLQPYSLHASVIDALAEVCRIEDGSESEGEKVLCNPSSRRGTRCVLLVRGCVVVSQSLGATPRLLRGPAFFGTSHIWQEGASLSNPRVVSRGRYFAMTLPGRALHDVIKAEPTLGMALLRMSFEQQQIMDFVYGANGESPVVRVATLLDHLATPKPVIVRADDGRNVVTSDQKLTVEGPSQTDIADCLGLGRATVEKAIATLRKNGVLVSPEPGCRRRNRYYEIADAERLATVVLGAADISPKAS